MAAANSRVARSFPICCSGRRPSSSIDCRLNSRIRQFNLMEAHGDVFGMLLDRNFTAQTRELSKKDKADELSAKRLELMQKKVALVKVKSGEKDFPVEFLPKAIFRYSDPARGYVAAAVWKLGETGRPRALLTTELHRFL